LRGIGHNAVMPEPPDVEPWSAEPPTGTPFEPLGEPLPRALPLPPPPLAPLEPPPSAAPQGYVLYTGAELTAGTHGFGTTVIALYWTAVGALVLVAAAVFHRKSVVDRIINGDFGGRRPRALDNEARALIGVASAVQIGITVAAAIVTSLWCRRVILNAQRAGITGLSTNKATIGWLIPFVWWYVGFHQLRLVLTSMDQSPRPVQAWQSAFILTSVFSFFTRSNGGPIRDLVALSDGLDRLGLLTLCSAGILAIAARKGSQVVRMFDRAFSPG
jgi:hypothetical protein